jgi:hypothetical protein
VTGVMRIGSRVWRKGTADEVSMLVGGKQRILLGSLLTSGTARSRTVRVSQPSTFGQQNPLGTPYSVPHHQTISKYGISEHQVLDRRFLNITNPYPVFYFRAAVVRAGTVISRILFYSVPTE